MLHPIVAHLSPSDKQKPAIITRDSDILVLAGAGTGKTRTLVARYLSLVAEGLPLRSILAITFTKKAAWEMRNRVRAEVSHYLDKPDLPENERRRWENVYTQLDASRIGTIHSFCSEILRTHPVEARVDPHFEVLEEGRANILTRQAIDEALAWAADNPQIVSLFDLLGERKLQTTLESLMRQRLDTEQIFTELPDNLLSHWQKELFAQQQKMLEELSNHPDWANSISVLENNAADDEQDRMENERRKALNAIAGFTKETFTDQLNCLTEIDRINLNGGRQGAWPDGKSQLAEVKHALRTLRGLWRERSGILNLALTHQDEILAKSIPSLRALFSFANQRYTAFKQDLNVLDFDDLENKALNLLLHYPQVCDYWRNDIRAVLVDEFQDTNVRQRDLLAMLNDNQCKQFAVGDAKQSIYRFRGADVTIFRQERYRIEKSGGTIISLETSYRAHTSLGQGLNTLLHPVLGNEVPECPWVEPFSPLTCQRTGSGTGFQSPYIELFLSVGSKGDGALQRSAEALAEYLINLVESKEYQVEDKGQYRFLCYGDIAILCRASTSFAAYENALEGKAPFLTVAGRGFYNRIEIRDLLNALKALEDPTDDLALTGLLRSPAFSLSDVALYKIHRSRNGSSLWESLKDNALDILEEEAEAAARAIVTIEDIHKQVGRTTVAALLKAFLDVTHYRAALIESGQKRGALNVAKLLADAHASGIVSVGEFLEYITSLRDSGAREGEARDISEGTIQIMSVHAAKGLEFPIVVIGDINYNRQNSNDLLLDPSLKILLPTKDEEDNLPSIYRLGKWKEDSQELAESNRLLYVAATRAREILILNGCIELKQDKTISKPKGWLRQIFEPLGLCEREIDYNETGSDQIRLDLEINKIPVGCRIFEPEYKPVFPPIPEKCATHPVRLPLQLLNRVSPQDARNDERIKEQDRIPPRRVWRIVPVGKQTRAPAWVIGSVIHEAIANWRFPGDNFDSWSTARARQYGITSQQQLENVVHESSLLLRRFQEHALFREIDSAQQRLHEVPYNMQTEDGLLDNGIIDALYLKDGTWTIVEFKSGFIGDEGALNALLDEAVHQTRRYVSAVENLLGQRPQALLCILNYNNTVFVKECP